MNNSSQLLGSAKSNKPDGLGSENQANQGEVNASKSKNESLIPLQKIGCLLDIPDIPIEMMPI